MARSVSSATVDLCLETCERIATRLDEEALWHGVRCNWIGGDAVDPARGRGLSHSALGPTLYSGTSGIALFLAELQRVQEDERTRALALGAIRQALSRKELIPEGGHLGLYGGRIGIALAATRVAMLLGDESVLDAAQTLVGEVRRSSAPSFEFDLVTGRAGAIVGLLVMSEVFEREAMREWAVLLGHELLRSAEESDRGLGWASPDLPAQPCLTGLSHGAAGAAYALVELAAATGEPRFRHAAELAFAYERSWFDEEAGNWPDLRDERRSSAGRARPLPCLAYWCHGAPGIALSRLRASEVVDDDDLRREALVGLRTTRTTVADAVGTGIGNFSLCHGIAGNADVLLHGKGDGDLELVAQVAELGAERYARSNAAWPCGTHAAETPSLMLGLAGIGYFYLRLADPSVPSVLAIRSSPSGERPQPQ